MDQDPPRRGMPPWLPERPVVVIQPSSETRPDEHAALREPNLGSEACTIGADDLASEVTLRIELTVARDLVERLVALVSAVAAGSSVRTTVRMDDLSNEQGRSSPLSKDDGGWVLLRLQKPLLPE